MAGCAAKEYEIKPISIPKDGEERIIYLIAVHRHNKISNKSGFLLYSTTDIEKWNLREDHPLIDALFFASEEEAFKMGETIVKMDFNRRLSGIPDQLPK